MMSSLGPYLLMAFLFLVVAVLTALDATLTHYALLPWFNGLRWLRVHFITLGMVTELAFGMMPLLVAAKRGLPRPKMRWDIWLTFNAGLIVLVAGVPLVNSLLIFSGGTLVFAAAALLMAQLWQMRPAEAQPERAGAAETAAVTAAERAAAAAGRPFFVVGLAYLLLGILVGTGLWIGWSEPLRIGVPIEVHIHANNWGFMSLTFAGLLIGITLQLTGRPLASPRALRLLFWAMTLGALGLVIGPWLSGNLWFLVPGLVLHFGATIWLVVVLRQRLAAAGLCPSPGSLHLISAYFWILAPVMVAPLILLGVPGFPGAGIERTAPQALIYGWVLQFAIALLPYFARRHLLHEGTPRLGGSWLGLLAVNVGSALIWVGIFLADYEGLLHGTGYALYTLALLGLAVEVGRIFRDGVEGMEEPTPAASARPAQRGPVQSGEPAGGRTQPTALN